MQLPYVEYFFTADVLCRYVRYLFVCKFFLFRLRNGILPRLAYVHPVLLSYARAPDKREHRHESCRNTGHLNR